MQFDDSLSNDELLMKADETYHKGYYKEAIEYYTSFLEKTKNAKAYNNRGFTYYKSVGMDFPLPDSGNKEAYIKGLENAINDFEKALVIDPDYNKAKENLSFMKRQIQKIAVQSA